MTRKRTVIFDAFDVVSVPFPFTDQEKSKKRPALVLSSSSTFNTQSGHSIMAMITSAQNAPWPLDVKVLDLKAAGLPAASVVRMKLFTLDSRFIISHLGTLNETDSQNVSKALKLALKKCI